MTFSVVKVVIAEWLVTTGEKSPSLYQTLPAYTATASQMST